MGVVRFPNEVADLITAESWTAGWGDRDGDGPTCLHGHVRRCGLKPGDEFLIAAVFGSGPGSMWWNDSQSDWSVVAGWARAADVSDELLASTFGPQWLQVVGLVRRLAVLSVVEVEQLGAARVEQLGGDRVAAWDAARDAAWDAAWDADRVAARVAAWDAARDAARGAARGAARVAARGGDRVAAWVAARGAAWGAAARAVAVADLVGQHGLEQHHIDTLLTPIREVLGDPLNPNTTQQWINAS